MIVKDMRADIDMLIGLGSMDTFKSRYGGFEGSDMLVLLGVSRDVYDFLVMNRLLVSDLEVYWDKMIEHGNGRLTIYPVDEGMVNNNEVK